MKITHPVTRAAFGVAALVAIAVFANWLVSLTPLGIPLIAGPGAIANVIVLWNEAGSFPRRLMVLVAITLVLFLTLMIFLGARRVAKFLGDAGNKVLLRLMGLITMVIAVEFFFSGLTPIVRRMLQPAG